MIWNEENKIWKSNGETQRPYGHQTFLPMSSITLTTKENQAHITLITRITTKAKADLIVWGSAPKNDLTHEFQSFINTPKDELIAAKATEVDKDKFNSKAHVWPSDMRYEDAGGDGSPSWNYTARTKAVMHTAELSAIVTETKELDV